MRGRERNLKNWLGMMGDLGIDTIGQESVEQVWEQVIRKEEVRAVMHQKI